MEAHTPVYGVCKKLNEYEFGQSVEYDVKILKRKIHINNIQVCN